MISLKGIISNKLRKKLPTSDPAWKGGTRSAKSPKATTLPKGVQGVSLGGRKKK